MDMDEIRELKNDAEYIKTSSPAWTGHSYACDYKDCVELMERLSVFESKEGNEATAERINIWLETANNKDKTIDMIPTELEELDNQFFEILDESISHLTDKTIDMEM